MRILWSTSIRVSTASNLHQFYTVNALTRPERALLVSIAALQECTDADGLSGSQIGDGNIKPAPLTTRALYHAVTDGEEKKISYSSFYNRIHRLEHLRLIDTYKQSLPTRGRVTEVMPRYEGGAVQKACGSEVAG